MNRLFLMLLIICTFSFVAVSNLQADDPTESADEDSAQETTDTAPVQATQQAVTPQQRAVQLRNELGLWMVRSAQAYSDKNYADWALSLENLHRLRPFNADFMRQMVMANAMSGEISRAFNIMLMMQQQGLTENWDAIDEVAPLRQYDLYEHLNRLMTEAGDPLGNPEMIATIDGAHAMPEALAHDSRDGRLFAGTIRDGEVLVRAADDEEWQVFASRETAPSLMSVFDLLADEERNHLWIATGSPPQYRHRTANNFGRTALIKLDLQTGELLNEYRVLPNPQHPHMLGAMTLASDGTIYAADTFAPFVFRLQPGDERPEVLLGNPVFSGLRGIALSSDEQRLYLSDYELGLFFFDLDEQKKGFRIGIPENLNVGGIDGLYRWNDSLIAVQNGVSPQRVMRLDLDASGTRVADIAPLLVAQPEFDTPTFGTIEGNDLIFLAASHWSKVDGNGRPLQRPLPDVPVMRVDVEEAPQLVVGAEMLEEMRRRSGNSVIPIERN
ncbi:MAG: hypothetical protein AAF446_03345 [Pseudomonadota bacterium]